MKNIRIKKSLIFDTPHKTIQQVRIQRILDGYKQKLNYNKRSNKSRIGYNETQKLSTIQAKCLEKLENKAKGITYNSIYKAFHLNCHQNISPSKQTIDPEKQNEFRKGVHYRSNSRSKGEGVKKVLKQDLEDYFERTPEEQAREDSRMINRSKTLQYNRALTSRESKYSTERWGTLPVRTQSLFRSRAESTNKYF